jgi:hypothetical protein
MIEDSPAAAADARFALRLEETGARDPREYYRGLLKELKGRDADAYQGAVARYEEAVVSAIAAGADPLAAWLAFGVELARIVGGPGRTVVVDETGRAAELDGPPTWQAMVLHLPEARGARGLPVGLPPELSSAQRATVDLLVHGKVRLPSDD